MSINIGIVLIIFSVVVSPEIPFLKKGIRAEDILFIFVVLAWIVSMTLRRKRWIYTELNLPIILVVFANFLSLINAYIFGNLNPFWQTPVPPLFSFFFFLKKVIYYGLFLVVANQVRTLKEVKFYTVLVLIAATIGSVYGIYTAYSKGITIRIYSPFDPAEANTFGQFLMFHILIALSLFFSSKAFSHRILLGTFLLLAFYSLLLTYSRGSYIALMIALLFFGIIREKKVLFAMALASIFYSIIFPQEVIDRIISGWTEIYNHFTGIDTKSSFSARVHSFEDGFSYAISSPIFGHGIGNVSMAHIEAQLPYEAVTTGFLGMFLFLWILYIVGKTCWYNFKNAKNPFISSLSFGLLCGLIGYMISGLSALPFTTIRTAEPFWIVCGLVFVLNRILKEGKEEIEFIPYEMLKGKIYKKI